MGLAAARSLQIRNTGSMKYGRCQVLTGQTVFQGQLLSYQYATKVSHCMPMTAVSGASMPCIGIAIENYATSLATALTTAVYFYDCEVRLPATGVTADCINKQAYVYAQGGTADKVCGAKTLGNPVGIAMELDGTSYCWVLVGRYDIAV